MKCFKSNWLIVANVDYRKIVNMLAHLEAQLYIGTIAESRETFYYCETIFCGNSDEDLAEFINYIGTEIGMVDWKPLQEDQKMDGVSLSDILDVKSGTGLYISKWLDMMDSLGKKNGKFI